MIKVTIALTYSFFLTIEFHFTPGSTSDVKALKDFSFDMKEGSKVYADGAYNDYNVEDILNTASGVHLIPKRKVNSRRKNKGTDDFFLRMYRNRIETVFSSINALMPRYIRAKTTKGFFPKVFFFVLEYTVKLLSRID